MPAPVDRVMQGRVFAIAAACAAALATPAVAGAREAGGSETCTLEAGPARAVVRVVDAATLALDDGSELRLAGIVVPRAFDAVAAEAAAVWPPEREAVVALRGLVEGRSIEIAYSGRRSDRYGRHVGHAFLDRDGARVWVQGALASAGHARAAAGPEAGACAAELLVHEAIARRAGLGLWGSAAYQTRLALRTFDLMRFRNTFQLVRGRVARVSATRSHTYLNFGTDWRVDFTVGISAGLMRRHTEWAARLEDLEGREVIVRGWIERRNGPYIELADPAELERDPTALLARGSTAPARQVAPASGIVPPLDTQPPNEGRPAREVPGAQGL